MKIRQLVNNYAPKLLKRYGSYILPSQLKALDSMAACRKQCGELYASCTSCNHKEIIPLSCGHRNCPGCQHNLGEQWLERQQQKLLPATYFMITFTLPSELRTTAWRHQRIVYELLFKAAAETLITIAKNNHNISVGFSAVLHTHKRDKNYHPHLHVIMPAGGMGLNNKTKHWKTIPDAFFVNQTAMAKVFRAIFLRMLFKKNLKLPSCDLSKNWVANIHNVGRGEKALNYLSRYLYRGVISENDILCDDQGVVRFTYKQSNTNLTITKKMPADEFLWALLKHVLPRRFRRVRDFGFLHGNAKKLLKRIQTELQAVINICKKSKPKLICRKCSNPMQIDLIEHKRMPMLFPKKSVVCIAPEK